MCNMYTASFSTVTCNTVCLYCTILTYNYKLLHVYTFVVSVWPEPKLQVWNLPRTKQPNLGPTNKTMVRLVSFLVFFTGSSGRLSSKLAIVNCNCNVKPKVTRSNAYNVTQCKPWLGFALNCCQSLMGAVFAIDNVLYLC